MALNKLEKILITIGVIGGAVGINVGISEDNHVLAGISYIASVASFGYALNNSYKKN